MRDKLFGVFLGVVGVLAASVPLVAHHGAASFATTKEYTLKGAVPDNPTDMSKLGWARTSFKAGDEVTVTLQPVKSGAPVGRLRSVLLPNGQRLGSGGPPPPAAAAVPAK